MSDLLLLSLGLDISQDLKVLTKLWTSSPKFANKKLLAGWLLSCSNLEFTNDIIINATFDTSKFRQKCRPYLTQFLNDIATRLQSIARMYLAKKKVQKKRIQDRQKKKKMMMTRRRTMKKGRKKRSTSSSTSSSHGDMTVRQQSSISDDEQSLASIDTEYSMTSPPYQQDVIVGSALETNSSIIVEDSPIVSSNPSVGHESHKTKSLELKKPLTQSMTRRLKETISAYSPTPKKKSSQPSSISQRSSSQLSSSTALPSSGSTDLMMEQVKYLKNDLSIALSHKQHSSELSQMREMMKTVLSEIKSLRHSDGSYQDHHRSHSSPSSHSLSRTRHHSNHTRESDNQSTELQHNLHSMFSQILNIQKDLSEQKILSSNISLQLQEQSQVILTSLNTQQQQTNKLSSTTFSSSSEVNSEALQDQKEEYFYLQQQKYENEIEKVTHLLQHKDQILQKELLLRNNLQERFYEIERNYQQQKKENERNQKMIQKLEKEHSAKQRELMCQIHATVSQLQGTQDELENYQKNVNDMNLNYQNSLLQITNLKSQLFVKEQQAAALAETEVVAINKEVKKYQEKEFYEIEKNKFQQKILELEKKNQMMEESIGSLQTEKTQMIQEIIQQKELVNQLTSQTNEKEILTKNLQKKIEIFEKEEMCHHELIAEKERAIKTIQMKFSELQLKVS
jgi:hypothetical protein